jgi:hypothetical protein
MVIGSASTSSFEKRFETARAAMQIEFQKYANINATMRLTLAFAELIDKKDYKPPETEEGNFVTLIVMKCAQEMLGFCGALNYGSFLGALHMVRSLMEVCASAHYVFGGKTDKKMLKFTEYPQLRLHLEVSDDHKPPAIKEQLEAKVESWKKLWDTTDLQKVEHWYFPTSIKDVLAYIPAPDDEVKKTVTKIYKHLCHAVHVSPSVKGITEGYSLVLKKDNLEQLNEFCHHFADMFRMTINALDKRIGTEFFQKLGASFLLFRPALATVRDSSSQE